MRSVVTVAIIVLLSTSLAAQATKPLHPSSATGSPNHDKDVQMWLENANVLTQEILDDGTANLPKYNDSVMNARLAEAWWKVDPKRAHQYMQGAIGIADDRKTETPVEGFKRLFVAVTVMQIFTPLDQERSEELLDSILTQSTRLGSQAKSEEELLARAYFADLIVEVSARYKTVTNERRAKLYRAMLNLGGENMSVVLLREIYKTDVGLGDQLFGETVDAVEQNRVPLWALVDVVSISIPPPPEFGKPLPVSDVLKDKAMRNLTQMIGKSLESGANDENCRPVMMLSTVLSSLPEDAQARMITANEECKAMSAKRAEQANTREEMARMFREGRPEDMLQLAESQNEVQRRAEWKIAVAGLMEQSDAERGIEILNELSPEEKAALPWLEMSREGLEAEAIKQVYGRGDFGGLQRLIDHSPTPAKTALAVVKVTIKKDSSYAASLMPTIVDRLGEGRLNVSEFYIDVINYVAKTSKPSTPVVFRDAIKGINLGVAEFIRGQSPHPEGGFKRTSFWWQLEPPNLPSLLDVMDQRSTRLAIDTLKFPMARASMRLWLLKSELNAYETASKAQKSSAAKSPAN